MKYISVLILAGVQLIIACSGTRNLAQPLPNPVMQEPVVEKKTETVDPIPEPVVKKDTLPPPAFRIDTLITVYYGPCYGKCQVYSIAITNDGLVYWHGYKNSPRLGSYLTKLTLSQKEQLEAWLNDPLLGTLANTYPVREEYITDFPVRQYRLKHINQTKLIEINHSPPALISQLESNLDNWLKQADWRRIDDK